MTPDQGGPGLLTIVIPVIIAAGLYVWTSIALARVFPRLGIPAWQAWVPVLNLAAIFGKAGIPGWQVVLLFVPIANLFGIYQLVIAFHRINLAFGKGPGMTALAVLLLPVWATIIGSETATSPTTSAQEDPVSDPQFPSVPSAVPPQQPSPPPVESTAVADAAPAVEGAAPAVPPLVPLPSVLPEAEPLVPPAAPAAPPPSSQPQPVDASRPSAFAPPPDASSQPVAPVVPPVIAPPPGGAVVPPVAPPVEPVDRGQVVLEEPIAHAEPVAIPEPVMPAPAEPTPVIAGPVASPEPSAVPEPAAADPVPTPPEEDEEEDRTVVVEDDLPEEDEEEEDRTVVVDRRPAIVWELVTEDGERLPLTSASVVLGRRPAPVPGSTVIAVPDATKTLSKVHARLDLVDEVWTITDLESTNGIFILESDGTERELDRSGSSPVTGSFLLGKVVLAIERVEDAG